MKDSGLIPIRFYQEFFTKDWSGLPDAAQDALASFLLELQKNPDSPEIANSAEMDTAGRLAYEFSPGYVVYWRLVRNESGVQTARIEVLAVLSTVVTLSETDRKSTPGGDSSIAEERDLIERTYSRRTALGNLAMWGTLHISRSTRKVKGWVVDSWSQGGEPYLNPKMHWVSFPDHRLHHMKLNVDFNSTMQVGEEDTKIEPARLIFIRATLRQWEQDWLEEQSKKTS